MANFTRMLGIILTSLLLGQAAMAMTWDDFIAVSLQKSPQIQQIRYQYEVPDLNYYIALENLNWSLSAESGSLYDRRETISNQGSPLVNSYTSSLDLSKSFVTGTDVSLTASMEDLKTQSYFYNPARHFRSDSYLLSVEQNLWQNAFGSAVRAQIESARKDAEIQKLQKQEALESALLKGAQLFWNAAVMKKNWVEAQAELKRYENMKKQVERKNRLKYTTPGEYEQVKAQYFSQVQQTRLAEVSFKQAMIDLKSFLPEVTEADLTWKSQNPTYEKAVQANHMDIDKTRSFQLTELQKEKTNFNADSVESANRSQLALVGQVGATGIAGSAASADQEWVEGRKPSLYVGVKWSHTFGNGTHEALIRSAKAQALAQEISTQVQKEDLRKQANLLIENISSLQSNLSSQNDELQSLHEGVQALTRSYNEGRTDISVLINLINQMQSAESSSIQARGNLELKFLQWQFLFDQISVD